jgi:hypothetical protein
MKAGFVLRFIALQQLGLSQKCKTTSGNSLEAASIGATQIASLSSTKVIRGCRRPGANAGGGFGWPPVLAE